MSFVRVAFTLLVGMVVSLPAHAQPKPKRSPGTYAMPQEYRDVQLSALVAQRKLLLSFIDSMPEAYYTERATPKQRTFAEQIRHIGDVAVFIARMMTKISAEDSTRAASTRAGLRAVVAKQYDWVEAAFKAQAENDRNMKLDFFGKSIPVWQVWDELNQHTWWTAGQLVANFRAHDIAPPRFIFF
jgi:hypothetical protein